MDISNKKFLYSTIIAIIAIIVPVISLLINTPKYDIMFNSHNRIELISNDSPHFTENIEVKYHDQNITNLYIYPIIIKNTGTEPIPKRYFEKPINIYFNDVGDIISVIIKEKKPSNLSVKNSIQNNKIIIDPLLLNPNDEIHIEILSTINKYLWNSPSYLDTLTYI